MSKLERLLNLTAALLETERPLTADELHHRVPGYPEGAGAYRRAFERDKEDLREMGVPLVLVAIQGTDPPIDGYRIFKDQYYLEDPGLAPDELAALHLAASAVTVEGTGGLEALWKLGGLEAGDTASVAPTVSTLPGDPRLADLFGALGQHRVVTFDYRDEPREVEPLRLDFQRGRWYLTGHDRVRDAQRNFRVDRIDGAVRVGDAYEPRSGDVVAGRRLQPWELGEGPPIVARLLIDADQAVWALQHLGRDAVVEERDDGSVVFDVHVTNRAAFRSFVITFLEHAEILGPADVRDELVAWLEAV